MNAAIASAAAISSRRIQNPSIRAMPGYVSCTILAHAVALALLAGCAIPPPPIAGCPPGGPCPACPVCPAPSEKPKAPALAPGGFADLPGWRDDDVAQAWSAFRASCRALRFREHWRTACLQAEPLERPDTAAVRAYFEANFIPYRVANPDGSEQGLVTGYYEPRLRGSRERRAPLLHPLYAPRDDLLVIDLASVAPETKNMRLRGRLDGRRVGPDYSRDERGKGAAPGRGHGLALGG